MKKLIVLCLLCSVIFSFVKYVPEKGLYNGATFSNQKDVINDSVVNKSSTIFLIDKSGSMGAKGKSGKSKWEEAKEAALKATSSILKGHSENQQVAFLTFSGGCVEDPTKQQTLNFSSDYKKVEQQLNALGRPGGGTPLHEAVSSAKKRLQYYSANYGDGDVSKLIVLSDGVATCGRIRPKEVYGTGTTMVTINGAATSNTGNNHNKRYRNRTNANNSATSNSSNSTSQKMNSFVGNTIPIKYFTIGFDIKPGSPAERDLQYLAGQTGGKYLNTQNEFELTRAFTKFFKVYYPKLNSSLTNLNFEKEHLFLSGVEAIQEEVYRKAQQLFEGFCVENPEDYNALFNLALMYEANDFHLQAIEKFERYLSLLPDAEDKEWVLEQIQLLQNDMLHFFDYTKKILKTDLEYLELHFKKIQNGESVALAHEFMGFVKEKEFYYNDLPSKLGLENKNEQRLCNTIQSGLNKCAKYIKKDPDNWDKNASSSLSLIFFNLEILIDTL
ncbi:VWA domain-containing protein [Flavivirga spongiicola]|uniref:VWA domain-containing protein n=1 Tax=Flavivirga spongiicola TaxID=421621 RepID=A0ABU7XTZ2_9FLAO|nr:VWA domain-containing protein [Flavivirga sp. MEBiC05379]MDO5979255.1 VWA domain-containing protein [Flavivirga sp. MEBiC05379]